MDIVGLILGVGEIADGVNGLIYTAKGDALNAPLSFPAMIPVVGWASTEKIEPVYSSIYQDVVNRQLGKTQNQLDILSEGNQFSTPNALAFNMPPTKMKIQPTINSGDVDVKTDIKNVDIESKGTGKSRIDYLSKK